MRYWIFSIAILLLASPLLARTPIGMQRWQIDDTTRTIQFGGMPSNYEDSEGWHPIENDFVFDDGSYKAENALLKTTVSPEGDVIVTFTHNDNDYTVTQRLHSLKFFRRTDSAWINIDNTPNWSNVSRDSNIVKWAGVFPGVDYRVRKSRGRVESGIFYKPAFLNSAVILLDQRPDAADIYLANVMAYTLTANIDDHEIPLGNIRKRVLKMFGGVAFQMGKQRLRYPGSDGDMEIPVWQRHIFVGNQLYILEFVKMSAIKQVHEAYPFATLWHNDTKTISNTTDVDDAMMRSNLPSNNYGARTDISVYSQAFFYQSLIRVRNVADSIGGGATITATVCSLYVISETDCTVYAYRCFKPWVEGVLNGSSPTGNGKGATWNDWSANNKEWATGGCENADDGGSDNSGDGTDADRKATAEDNVFMGTINTWYEIDITTTLAQGWYDGTINEEGILLKLESSCDGTGFSSMEAGSNQPIWAFTYTTEAAPGGRRRRLISGGWAEPFNDLRVSSGESYTLIIIFVLFYIGVAYFVIQWRKSDEMVLRR